MPVTQIENVAALASYAGKEAGVSDWLEVSQERIDQFAEATEDRQWIHIDPERAARDSPYKTTIAHGFLTLSLLSVLARLAISVGGVRMGINYGLNRARDWNEFKTALLSFTAPTQNAVYVDVDGVLRRRGERQ